MNSKERTLSRSTFTFYEASSPQVRVNNEAKEGGFLGWKDAGSGNDKLQSW
jgi:hypothetical protein